MLRMNKGMNIYIDSDNRKKMNKYKVKIMNDIDFLLFSWKDTSAQAYNLWSSLSQISYHIAVRFSCIQGKCLFLETNSRLRGHRVLQSDVGRVDCVFQMWNYTLYSGVKLTSWIPCSCQHVSERKCIIDMICLFNK